MLNASLFANKKTVAVALSGGKDSVFLLHLLISKRQELNITVKAVNVEHGIRGQNSVSDTLFVKNLCKHLQIELKTYSVNAPQHAKNNGLSLENSARILRYECFNNAVISGFCDCIATAHHQSDNVETMLLNFLRGCSISGLCGIPKASENKFIIRPILHLCKQEIDDYIEKNNLPFVTDESNFSNDFSRNFLRNEVIPLIKQKFPSFENSAQKLSEIANEENDFLNTLASELICDNKVLIKNDTNKVLFKRACLIVIKNMGFGVNYEKSHLDALWNLKACETGCKVNLKAPLIAYKSYDCIVFETQNEKEQNKNQNLQIPFSLGCFNFAFYTLNFEKSEAIAQLNDKNALFFDADKLPKNSVIRFKKQGDKITAFGGKNKSLKKFLTDKKIEARVSKTLPVIANGDKIYAVLGVDISHDIKVDENTRTIIKFTFTTKEN